MNETFTLAHLSDLHLTAVEGFEPRYWNTKRVLGYVNWRRARRSVHRQDIADRLIADAQALRVDHIAVTGDLVNLGLPAEHDAALRWLKQVGPPERVTVIPGNHDIYSAMRGDRGVARWAAYMGRDEEHALVYPFLRRFGAIALLGLNSAEETPPFIASGRVGADQIEVAGTLLQSLKQEGAIRVVLLHHPPLEGLTPARRALKDASHVTRMLEKHGAELVLYGHNHTPAINWLKTVDGPLPLIGAASGSSARVLKHEPLAQYNLFTFFRHPKGLRIRHTVRGLEHPDGAVVRLSEHVLEQGTMSPASHRVA